MKTKKRIMHALLTMLLFIPLASLIACSSGGSNHSSTSTPETDDDTVSTLSYTAGVWTGTGTSEDHTTKNLVIMPEQPLQNPGWMLTMDQSYNPEQFTRFQADVEPSGEQYQADGTRYYLTDYLPENVTIHGTFIDEENVTFAIDEDTTLFTRDDSYDPPASASEAAFSWRGSYGDQGTVTLSVGADGQFTAVRENNPGCTFSGHLTPHTEQSVYDVIFDETTCGGYYLEGLGVISAPLSRIYLMLTTEDGSDAAIFVGEKVVGE